MPRYRLWKNDRTRFGWNRNQLISRLREDITSLPISLGLYVLADLCEIGGGYLVWLWFREGRPLGYGMARATILILYGIIRTFQAAHFGGFMLRMAVIMYAPRTTV